MTSPLQTLAQPPSGTPEVKIALANRVPGTASISNTLFHSGLYPSLVLHSNSSTDVTTPRTEPQNTFDRNMDALFQEHELSWAT